MGGPRHWSRRRGGTPHLPGPPPNQSLSGDTASPPQSADGPPPRSGASDPGTWLPRPRQTHRETGSRGQKLLEGRGGRPGCKDRGRGSRRGSLPPAPPSLLGARDGRWRRLGTAGRRVPRLGCSPPGGRGAEPEDRGRGARAPPGGQEGRYSPRPGRVRRWWGSAGMREGRLGDPAPGARPGGCWGPRAPCTRMRVPPTRAPQGAPTPDGLSPQPRPLAPSISVGTGRAPR